MSFRVRVPGRRSRPVRGGSMGYVLDSKDRVIVHWHEERVAAATTSKPPEAGVK